MKSATSFCSYYNSKICQSCEWIEKSYDLQLAQKEKALKETLQFLWASNRSDFLIEKKILQKTVRSELQGFRNRAKMSVTGSVDSPIIGLTGEESLDQGRELLNCPIHHPKLNELIQFLPSVITEHQLAPYQIKKRQGELKGLIAFYASETNQMYLRFILRSKESVARIQKLTLLLQKQFPHLVCVSANIQPIPHAILEGEEEVYLTHNQAIDYPVGAYSLRLSPQAFVQTNTAVAQKLYQTAASWIREANVKKVLELFCGIGAFSFAAASKSPNVAGLTEGAACSAIGMEFLGIEINESAAVSAQKTADHYGLTSMTFKQADATKTGDELKTFQPDLILVNPPRRGLKDGIQLIKTLRPGYLIYSSCSVESLALDLSKILATYKLKKIQVFDLFPHTKHFETLVWLERI